MKINVSKLENKEGKPVPISEQIRLENIEYKNDILKVKGNISVEGTAIFSDDIITISVDISATVIQHCRRCLTEIDTAIRTHEVFEFRPEMDLDISSKGKTTIYNYKGESEIDLMPIIKSFIRLKLEPYPLCSSDCKGLCPNCGANLNKEENHQCEEKAEEKVAEDPRMEKLADLL